MKALGERLLRLLAASLALLVMMPALLCFAALAFGGAGIAAVSLVVGAIGAGLGYLLCLIGRAGVNQIDGDWQRLRAWAITAVEGRRS